MMEKYRRRVFRYLLGSLGSQEDALDLTQDVFLRICSKAHTYNGEAPLNAWVFRVVRNLRTDQSRKKNFKVVSNAVSLDHVSPDASSSTRTPEQDAGSSEIFRRVQEAIAALPPRQQEVVRLRLLAELSLEETAGVSGLSLGGVKSTLHNALANLRKELRDLEQSYVHL